MSRKIRKEGTVLHFWQTPEPKNLAKRYFILDSDFFDHPAVKALTPGELKVLLLLHAHCCGQESFAYSYAAAGQAGVSASTFKAALRRLQEAGFIVVASGKPQMTVNQITFSNSWKVTEPEIRPKAPRGAGAKNFKTRH